MCGALCYSDRVLTVSPTYAEEICTPAYGEGLDSVFRRRREQLRGILNGIDYQAYNPEKDKYLPARFSAADLAGKAECKAALQARLGLPENPQAPLLVLVSRLTEQKGLDLLLHILQELLQEEPDLQLAVLGQGDERYEHDFGWFGHNFPQQVAYRCEFSDDLAHNFYAAGDLLLMPSRFEPCGLAQLIAMRYGTLPVVRECGGLKDSVQPYNRFTGEGTGFGFANYNAHELLFTLQNALTIYREEPEIWQRLMGQAMQQDFSWQRSAHEYAEVYKELLDIWRFCIIHSWRFIVSRLGRRYAAPRCGWPLMFGMRKRLRQENGWPKLSCAFGATAWVRSCWKCSPCPCRMAAAVLHCWTLPAMCCRGICCFWNIKITACFLPRRAGVSWCRVLWIRRVVGCLMVRSRCCLRLMVAFTTAMVCYCLIRRLWPGRPVWWIFCRAAIY